MARRTRIPVEVKDRLDNDCIACGLWKRSGCASPNMLPIGSDSPLIYFLGLGPGKEEDAADEQFIGRAGGELFRGLWDLGLRRKDKKKYRLYNAVNCLPPKNKPTKEELRICSKRVREDIRRTKPRVIVPVGNEALQALWPNLFERCTKISGVRGHQIPYHLGDGNWATVIPTYHPSYIMQYALEQEKESWMRDLADALDIAFDTEAMGVEHNAAHGLYEEPDKIQFATSMKEVRELFRQLKDEPRTAFDWETCGLRRIITIDEKTGKEKKKLDVCGLKPWSYKYGELLVKPQPYALGFALEKANKAVTIPMYDASSNVTDYGGPYWSEKQYGELMDLIGEYFLTNDDQIKIAHNLGFDMLWAAAFPVQHVLGYDVRERDISDEWRGQYHDTLARSWLFDSNTRAGMTKLKSAAFWALGKEDWSIDVINFLQRKKGVPIIKSEDAWDYCGKDCWYTLKLDDYFVREMENEEEFDVVYHNHMLPAIKQFLKMELLGIETNEKQLDEFNKKYKKKLSDLTNEIFELSDEYIEKPTRKQQVSEFFVDHCKYTLLKETQKEGVWSVDKATLEHVRDYYDEPVAKLLLEYNEYSTLNNRYIEGTRNLIIDDGRLHSSYGVATTSTGRTSSSNPAMQNWPIREHPEIRKIVKAFAGKGCVFLKGDYGQVEGRIAGGMIGDENFCHLLWEKLDFHTDMQEWLKNEFDIERSRAPVKNADFGTIYGAGDFRIAQTLNVDMDVAEAFRERIFVLFPEIASWQEWLTDFGYENGWVKTLYGKRRYEPMNYNERINSPIQGTCGDILVDSMNHLGKVYRIANEVHDELDFYTMLKMLEDRIAFMAECMVTIPWIIMSQSDWLREWVPLSVEFEVGENWGELEKMREFDSFDFGIDSLSKSCKRGLQLIEQIEKGKVP